MLRCHILFPNRYVLSIQWIGSELNRKLNCSQVGSEHETLDWRCVIFHSRRSLSFFIFIFYHLDWRAADIVYQQKHSVKS